MVSLPGLTVAMTLEFSCPQPEQLIAVAERLSRWQAEPWAGQLHPGDLGWHSAVGPEQMARDLRVWEQDGEPVAVGMLDGSDVLRMSIAPSFAEDRALAEHLAGDLDRRAPDLLLGDVAVVEARGATALRGALKGVGWVDDEPWTPMTLDLSGPLDLERLHRAHLRIVEVGPESAEDWTCVHWSAFKGTPFDDDARTRFAARWTDIMTGPFADRAHSLIAYDTSDTPVAVTTVWTAGSGRPGLVEPMGVRRGHHGMGYGVAITLAGARTLQEHGATSAAVVAENSNAAALATYGSAGFFSLGEVTDLKRP